MSVTDDDEDPEFLAMLAESVKAEKDREQEDKGTLNLVKRTPSFLNPHLIVHSESVTGDASCHRW